MASTLIWVIVLVSSIWVLIDARKIGVQKGQIQGIANMGPVAWLIACLFLWIIAFPMYLIKRPEYRRANGKSGSNLVVSIAGSAAIAVILVVTVLSFTGAIKISTGQLQAEVQQSIQSTWANDPNLSRASIDAFNLVHKSGNQYEGMLEATIDGRKEKVFVDVTYDGQQFMWQIRQ